MRERHDVVRRAVHEQPRNVDVPCSIHDRFELHQVVPEGQGEGAARLVQHRIALVQVPEHALDELARVRDRGQRHEAVDAVVDRSAQRSDGAAHAVPDVADALAFERIDHGTQVRDLLGDRRVRERAFGFPVARERDAEGRDAVDSEGVGQRFRPRPLLVGRDAVPQDDDVVRGSGRVGEGDAFAVFVADLGQWHHCWCKLTRDRANPERGWGRPSGIRDWP